MASFDTSSAQFREPLPDEGGEWRWLSWVVVPENGKFYFTTRDITEQKEQAKALASREAERNLLWRKAQDLLVIADTKGVFQDVSAAATKILGWQPHEMIGQSAFDFIHPDDVSTTLDAHARAQRDELPPFVNRYRHKDGSYRWFSWVAAPEGGLIFATARHITVEREQAKALAGSAGSAPPVSEDRGHRTTYRRHRA